MTILVTGASGFIAKYVVSDLLKEEYKVIATVRSQEKADRLKKQFGNNPNLSFEVVSDMAVPNAFDIVFERHSEEIKVVLHTASPFFVKCTDYEKELIIPAVNGTKNILKSIKKYAANTVERVVITSSLAALMDIAMSGDADLVCNEESWNPVTWESCQTGGMRAYCGSKKLAEKAAWEFYNENKDAVKFKMSTVLPVYVFGPQCFDEDVKGCLNQSCELINALIQGDPQKEAAKTLAAQFIDVRDVAKAHLIAFQKDEAIEQRLIVSNGQFTFQDVIDQLNEDFPQLRSLIPEGKFGEGKKMHRKFFSLDNTKSRKILGFAFKSFKETIDDSASQILKQKGML